PSVWLSRGDPFQRSRKRKLRSDHEKGLTGRRSRRRRLAARFAPPREPPARTRIGWRPPSPRTAPRARRPPHYGRLAGPADPAAAADPARRAGHATLGRGERPHVLEN